MEQTEIKILEKKRILVTLKKKNEKMEKNEKKPETRKK